MKWYRLFNVQKGYAEVWVSSTGDFSRLDGIGCVRTERFVERSDFEKDTVTYRTRWVAYLYGKTTIWPSSWSYEKVGRALGYATRKEAIEALANIAIKALKKE